MYNVDKLAAALKHTWIRSQGETGRGVNNVFVGCHLDGRPIALDCVRGLGLALRFAFATSWIGTS